MLQKGRRVGAVPSRAIGSYLPVPGSVGHEGVPRWLNSGEATPDAASATGRHCHLRRKGIVATGIEQNQP